jgi:hypothetical protein
LVDTHPVVEVASYLGEMLAERFLRVVADRSVVIPTSAHSKTALSSRTRR